MMKKLLLIFISLLIAIQVVAAAVDNHKTIVSSFEQTVSYSHSDFDKQKAKTIDSTHPVETQYDCSHFCHCHGMAKLFSNLSSVIDIDIVYLVQYDLPVNYSSVHLLPNLRPPIA